MNYKLIIEYDGLNFFGMQKLKGKERTVQAVLENELSKVFEEEIKICYSSRTDRFVSAFGQVVSFESPRVFEDLVSLTGRLNRLLPEDVKIVSLSKAKDGFIASRGIKSKTYEFKIFNAPVLPPLRRHGFVHIKEPLNIAKMRRCAKILTGKHDFTSFCKAECEKEIKVRTVHKLCILKKGVQVKIVVVGDGFLQHMVRIIAGTLIMAGKGILTANDVKNILENKDRRHKGKTESAKGLALIKIEYLTKHKV